LGMAKTFHQLEGCDQRKMLRLWEKLHQVRTWANGQLDRLQRQWVQYPGGELTRCLMIDKNKQRKQDRSAHYQSVLHSKEYDRMYELDS